MGILMTASRGAVPLPKKSLNSTNVNSTIQKPNKICSSTSNINSIKCPVPPAMECPPSSTVVIPAISVKLLRSSSKNGKTPLDILLENPIPFVKASPTSPVYKYMMSQKEAFGTSNRSSVKKLGRVKNPPTRFSSPHKGYVEKRVKAKTNGTSPKVPLPGHRKDTYKPVNFSAAMDKTDIVKETYKPGVTMTAAAATNKTISSPASQGLNDGDIDMPDACPLAPASVDIGMSSVGPPKVSSTDNSGAKSAEILPAVAQSSHKKTPMSSDVNNDITKNLTNGDAAVVKTPVKVLTNSAAAEKEPIKEVSKKRKAEDPGASPAMQKRHKGSNGDFKQTGYLRANEVNGGSSKQPRLSPLRPGVRTKGLPNKSNDCYRNSVLQLICSSSVFYEEILKHDFDKCKIGFCVCCGLGSLFRNHHFKPTSTYRNKVNDAIKDVVRLAKVLPKQFRGVRQEDAAEYLHAILHSCKDQLTKGLNGDALKNNPIDKTFDGSFPSVLTCPKCSHRSFNRTDLPSLMLLPSIRADQNRPQNTTCLKEVLGGHFRPEKVDATCERCKFTGKRFTKQIEVEKLPKFLVLNVVRWTQACLRGGEVKADKIMNRLRYEEKMTMMEDGKKVEYLLNAVVAHSGRSLSCGHYVSFVRQPDGSWALCNDQYVGQTTWEDVATAGGMQASILGYQRVD